MFICSLIRVSFSKSQCRAGGLGEISLNISVRFIDIGNWKRNHTTSNSLPFPFFLFLCLSYKCVRRAIATWHTHIFDVFVMKRREHTSAPFLQTVHFISIVSKVRFFFLIQRSNKNEMMTYILDKLFLLKFY